MQTNPKAWSRNSFVLLVTVWACLLFPTGVLSEEKEAERDKPIVLSDSARRALDLQTTIIRPKPVSVAISTVGKVEAIPTREFVQHAPLSGRVIEVLIKLGDRVAAGQTLAMLNSPEINILASETLQTKSQVESEIKRSRAELDAEISQARAQVELTQANYSRDKQLYEEQIGSLKTMQTSSAELKVAESRLQMASKKKEAVMEGLATKLKLTSDSLIRRLQQLGATSSHVQKMLKEQRTILYVPLVSAREGVISRIDTSPGQSIDPADPLFVVSDLRKVWATANIYENDICLLSALGNLSNSWWQLIHRRTSKVLLPSFLLQLTLPLELFL
jgi:multidrug efflux pump subunit AcrA (membrane-fusion protein)